MSEVRLILGDCVQEMSRLPPPDALVTDPPYGIGERMQGGTWGAAEKYADFRDWDVAPSAETIEQLRRMAGKIVIWGGNYFPLPPTRCWFLWDKQNPVNTMASFEMAWTNLDRPARRFRHPVGIHAMGHPTEKPLTLMLWCLRQLDLPEGSTVLDPYMGTGTTGVACEQMGLNFIGVEINPTYFAIAQRRIATERTKGNLFEGVK